MSNLNITGNLTVNGSLLTGGGLSFSKISESGTKII